MEFIDKTNALGKGIKYCKNCLEGVGPITELTEQQQVALDAFVAYHEDCPLERHPNADNFN